MIRGIARKNRRLFTKASAVIFSAFVGLSVQTGYAAQDLKPITESGDWSAWSFMEEGMKTCFLLSRPTKSLPTNVRRGEIHLHVTHRNARKTFDVITFAFGYPLDAKKKVTLSIDKNYYSLVTNKETAWAKNTVEEKKIVKNMIRGKKLLVKAVSQRGTKTTDTYSLIGFTAAYKAMNRACNVKR